MMKIQKHLAGIKLLPVKTNLAKLMSFGLMILLIALPAMANDALSQSVNVRMAMRNSTVADVIKEFSKQTGYEFSYDAEILNRKVSAVSINAKSENVETVLKQIFEGADIDFKIVNNRVFLKNNKTSESAPGTSVSAVQQQGKTVTGVVVDNLGDPVIGATIVVRGDAGKGTVTDIDGKFVLTNIPENAVLEISYVGMKTQTVEAAGKSSFNIALLEDLEMLDELVVVGYGTMKKRDVNAAISSIAAADLTKVSSPDISSMLQGRAAGITVVPATAQPGGWINILIRGAASTGAGNDPLYVIDGFPIVNSSTSPGSGNQWYSGSHSALSNINPNDVESIEILKDASATAIYGARGANGVILITTKRGSTGTKVDYSFNTSIQTIAKKPELLNGQELMIEQEKYYKELFLIKNNIYPYGDTDPNSISPYVPSYTQEQIDLTGPGTNWYDQVTQNGIINQHNLSINYGNENIRSYVSFNIFDQKGIVKTSGYNRFNFRYNLDHKIVKWWDYGVSALVSLDTENMATLGDGRDATAGIIESAMNYNPRVVPEKDPITGAWIEDKDQALLNHPLSFLDIYDKTKRQRFLGTAYTNIYLYKNELWLKLSGGADIRNGVRRNYYPRTMRYGAQVGGDANMNSTFREDYLSEALLNYQKNFENIHSLNTLIGYSYQIQNEDGYNARATGFSTDALMYYNLAAGQDKPQVSSYKNKHVLSSYFTRMQYSYLEKYIFTINARIDGSDRFGENNRYAFFPSAAFAWRANQEDFLKDVNWLYDLKFRLSAGQVGNENIGNGSAISFYTYNGADYYFGDTQYKGMALAKLPNKDLKWETTTEYNLGIDFGFLKNRINGSFDVYYKEIKDLLSYRKLPYGSIVNGVIWNVGKTQSKGVELAINTINLEKPLYWKSTFTFTAYRDNWLERDPEVILAPYQKEKEALTSIYTLVPDGLLQPGEFYEPQPNLMPGQEKFKDLNGLDENGKLTGKPDGKIDIADATYLGTSAPKFNAGLNNYLSYRNFDLSFFLYASVGAYRWPSTLIEHNVYGSYGLQRLSSSYNFLKEIQNRWSSTNMTSGMSNGLINNYQNYGNPRFQNASFLRLQNISMGYNINNFFRSRLQARLYITGQNLLTITNYSGLDPEVENNRAAYPQQRTFSFGIDIKF